MRFDVYFQMSINLYNAEIEEEKHLITLGHHNTVLDLPCSFKEIAADSVLFKK